MAVKNSDQFEAIPANSIGDDVRSLRDNQLPRSYDSSRSAHFGLSFKKVNRIENAFRNQSGILLRVFCDELSQTDQVLDRSA